jgi:hypothetical protein
MFQTASATRSIPHATCVCKNSTSGQVLSLFLSGTEVWRAGQRDKRKRLQSIQNPPNGRFALKTTIDLSFL